MTLLRKWKSLASISLTGSIVFAAFSGCVNVFSPLDSPSGDAQILSAARAAFDRGDVNKAREYYEKLGSNEAALSEKLFIELEACGAGIGTLASALSKGADSVDEPGILLTVMAEKMNPSRSANCFARLLDAYQDSRSITDKNLRGFSSFLTALAIAGEVLAHNDGIGVSGEFKKTDYLDDPAACRVSNAACSVGCYPGADGIITGGIKDLTSAPTIGADWGTLHGAIQALSLALSELDISGSGSASFELMDQITNFFTGLGGNPTLSDDHYRCILNEVGVGR